MVFWLHGWGDEDVVGLKETVVVDVEEEVAEEADEAFDAINDRVCFSYILDR